MEALDTHGNIILSSVDGFIKWFSAMTSIQKVLKNGNGIDLETCHYVHLLQALRVINERVKQIPIDELVLKEIRSFLYKKLEPWVHSKCVASVKSPDGTFIYSCQLNYPDLTKFNTWEEYESSMFNFLEEKPLLTEKERAEIEASLLSEKPPKSNGGSKKPTKRETQASETRSANEQRDQKKKDAEKFAKELEDKLEEIRRSKLEKQRKIAEAKRKKASEKIGGASVQIVKEGSAEQKEDK